MILILSDHLDVHVYPVIRALKARGIPFSLVEPGRTTGHGALSMRFGSREAGHTLTDARGRALCLDDVRAVWMRKPGPVRIPEGLSEAECTFVHGEREAVVDSVYRLLDGREWLNRPEAMRLAASKPVQLDRAQALGLSIPRTVLTNDPLVAREFVASCVGGCITKPLGRGLLGTRSGPWEDHVIDGIVYTSRVDGLDESELDRVRLAPVLLQEYVPKRLELRITIVDGEVFAAEIHSQEHPGTVTDWRRDGLMEVPHRVHALPSRLQRDLLSYLVSFGLAFGTIDMILTPDGRYVFLEVNPNGNYLWIENKTGLPISRAIADALCRRLSRGVARCA